MASPPNAFASDPSFNRYKGSYFNNDVDVSGGNIICRNGNLYLASNSSIYSPTNQINFDDTYQYLNCLQNVHIFGNTICDNNLTLTGGNFTMPNNSSIQTSGNSITFDDSYNFVNIPNNFHIYQQFQLDYGGTTYDVGQKISNIGNMDYNATYQQHTFTNILTTGMLQIRDVLSNDIDLVPKLRDLYSGIYTANNVSNTFTSQQNFSNNIRLDGSLIVSNNGLTLSNNNLSKIQYLSNVVSDVNTSLANRVTLTGVETISGQKNFGGTQNFTNMKLDGTLAVQTGTVTLTNLEISRLSGVSSNIQSQINTLNTRTTAQSYNSTTNTTTFTSTYLVGNYLHAQTNFRLDGALYLTTGTLFIPQSTLTSIQYLNGTTSNINTSISNLNTKTTNITYTSGTNTTAFTGVLSFPAGSISSSALSGVPTLSGNNTFSGICQFSIAPTLSGAGISAGTIQNSSLANTFFDVIANNTLSGQNTFSTTGTTTYNGDIRLDGNLKVGTAGGTIISNSSLAFLSGISEGVQSAIDTLKDKVNNITRSTTTTNISGTTACDTITFSGTLNSISTTIFGYLSGVSSNIQTQLNGLNNSINSLSNIVSGIDSSLPPIGSIIFHLSNGLQTADPSRFIKADGGYYSRTTYSVLFGIIGTDFGSSNASNFQVPNYQSVFLRCAGANTIGGTYYQPNAYNVAQQDAMIAHTHAAQSGQYLGNTLVTEALQGNRYATGVTRPQVYNFASTGAAQGTGVRTSSDENRPVNYSCYYYIRAY